jgi:hypothetical protein
MNPQMAPIAPKTAGVTGDVAATATNKINVAELASAVSNFTSSG